MTISHFRDCSILTSNTPHHARIYELIMRQEPKQARMCGVGGKADRRPIDPPPIVQLRVIDSSSSTSASTATNSSAPSHTPPSTPPPHTTTTHSHYPNHEPGPPPDPAAYAQSYLQNPYYFMFASLAKPDDDAELHWLKDGRTRCTTGSVVSSLYHLKDPQHNNEDAGFFVFPDLSVRTEGSYRLKLSLFEVVGNNVRHCKSIYSAPFYVYTAKKFPGMEESTPLSCSLADQGIKIRIRKDIRVRKRPMPALDPPVPLPLTSPHQQYPSNALPSSSFPQAGSSSQSYDDQDDGGGVYAAQPTAAVPQNNVTSAPSTTTTTTGPPTSIPPPPGATFLGGGGAATNSGSSSSTNAGATSPTTRQPSNAPIYHQTQQTQGPPPYGYGQYTTTTSPSQQSHTAPSSASSQTGPPSTGYGASSTGSSPEWNGYAQPQQQQQHQQWTGEGYAHSSQASSRNGGDRIQLAPLRHHSSALSVTSSAGTSPIIPSPHNGSSDVHTASYSVIQLRSPGRDNTKMLPPPTDFGRDRDRRGSLTDQRVVGKKNPLSIGSIISNSNDK
ncbi:hypothetical protein AN958_03652 [Leucoagaricus sp. SymC.cos]|nr:hypothetical protein AN958_03652 [Leucoagaricus sp. SymC.cos]